MKTEPTCLPQVGSFFIGVSMNGWIKFHKKTIENEMWRNDRTAWHIFEGLLMIVKTETGSWSGGRLQMSQLFGIKDTTIYKALLRLQKANMVTLSSNNKFSTIHICNWKKYQAVSNNASNNKVTTKGQQSNTLKRNKETRNKESSKELAKAEYGKPEINEMFEYWKSCMGYEISSKVADNRKACYNLYRKHGDETLRRLIGGVAVASEDKYAPRISDFIQLQAKLNELLAWGKKQGTSTKKGLKL